MAALYYLYNFGSCVPSYVCKALTKGFFCSGEGFKIALVLWVMRLTTGVVTAVSIQCVPRPRSVQVAFLQCPSFEAVQQVLQSAKSQLGEVLAACEFLDAASMGLVTTHLEGVRNPLGPEGQQEAGPFYMVVETHGSSAAHDMEKLNSFLEVSSLFRCL
jgi:FAD/FMN-containing dehydrogenase